MIKFEIKLGASYLNKEAREIRDLINPQIKGMRCSKCKVNTIIDFYKGSDNHAYHRITSCCTEFEKRVKDKLFHPKSN